MNWPVPILEGYILFEVSSSLIIWSDRLISTRKCQVFSCSICFFITEESSLLRAVQPVYPYGDLSHAAVQHSLSWVCASGMAFDGISFSWGRWVPLLSSWGSSAVWLLSQGFRCVLVLLLAYGLFLVGVCSCRAATRSLFSLHEYCTTTCWVCQVAVCSHPGGNVASPEWVFRRAVQPPLGGALVCVGYGVGGGELSRGGLRWRATRSNSHLSPLCTDITWFNLLLFVYSNFERFLYFSSYYLLNEPVWVVFSCHISALCY